MPKNEDGSYTFRSPVLYMGATLIKLCAIVVSPVLVVQLLYSAVSCVFLLFSAYLLFGTQAVTRQYTPVDNTIVYNGLTGVIGRYEL